MYELFLSFHILITTIVFLIFLPRDNPWLYVPFFIGGVFVDLDHCLDYYLRYRKPTFSHKELSKGVGDRKFFIVPLHSYEFMLVAIFAFFYFQNIYVNYIVSGYFLHMFLDIVFNRYESLKYLSLTYRLKNWWKIVCLDLDVKV